MPLFVKCNAPRVFNKIKKVYLTSVGVMDDNSYLTHSLQVHIHF